MLQRRKRKKLRVLAKRAFLKKKRILKMKKPTKAVKNKRTKLNLELADT